LILLSPKDTYAPLPQEAETTDDVRSDPVVHHHETKNGQSTRKNLEEVVAVPMNPPMAMSMSMPMSASAPAPAPVPTASMVLEKEFFECNSGGGGVSGTGTGGEIVLDRNPNRNPNRKKDIHEDYDIGKSISVASALAVKECVNKKTGKTFAVKIIDKHNIKTIEENIYSELNVLQRLNHPNIICLKEFYETEDKIYIISELVRGDTLFNRIVDKGHFTEKESAYLVKEILNTVNYMHKNNIAHRNLKLEKFLFKDKSKDSPLMITGFTYAKFVDPSIPLNSSDGIPGYTAPEIIEGKGHVWLWIFGILV